MEAREFTAGLGCSESQLRRHDKYGNNKVNLRRDKISV